MNIVIRNNNKFINNINNHNHKNNNNYNMNTQFVSHSDQVKGYKNNIKLTIILNNNK